MTSNHPDDRMEKLVQTVQALHERTFRLESKVLGLELLCAAAISHTPAEDRRKIADVYSAMLQDTYQEMPRTDLNPDVLEEFEYLLRNRSG